MKNIKPLEIRRPEGEEGKRNRASDVHGPGDSGQSFGVGTLSRGP